MSDTQNTQTEVTATYQVEWFHKTLGHIVDGLSRCLEEGRVELGLEEGGGELAVLASVPTVIDILREKGLPPIGITGILSLALLAVGVPSELAVNVIADACLEQAEALA